MKYLPYAFSTQENGLCNNQNDKVKIKLRFLINIRGWMGLWYFVLFVATLATYISPTLHYLAMQPISLVHSTQNVTFHYSEIGAIWWK